MLRPLAERASALLARVGQRGTGFIDRHVEDVQRRGHPPVRNAPKPVEPDLLFEPQLRIVLIRVCDASRRPRTGVQSFESRDDAHGRLDYRIVRTLPLAQLPAAIKAPWTGLQTIVQIDRVTVHRAYYVTSHGADPKPLAARIRAH